MDKEKKEMTNTKLIEHMEDGSTGKHSEDACHKKNKRVIPDKIIVLRIVIIMIK